MYTQNALHIVIINIDIQGVPPTVSTVRATAPLWCAYISLVWAFQKESCYVLVISAFVELTLHWISVWMCSTWSSSRESSDGAVPPPLTSRPSPPLRLPSTHTGSPPMANGVACSLAQWPQHNAQETSEQAVHEQYMYMYVWTCTQYYVYAFMHA